VLIVKAAIWALLLASVLVFVLGALLSFKRVRDLLAQMSQAVEADLAAHPLADLRKRLYEYLLRVFFLTRNGRVSRLKTLGLGVAGVASLVMAADLMRSEPAPDAALELAQGAVMAVPVHWLVEYQCVVWFFRAYKRLSGSGLARQVARATLASLSGTVAACIGASLAMVGLVVTAMVAMGERFDPGFLLAIAPAVMHGYTLVGLFLIDVLLGLEIVIPNRGPVIALMLVSVTPTFFAILLWLVVAAISTNHSVLHGLKRVLDRLGSLTAPILMGISYTLFRHALDLMQAYSFLAL